MKSETLTYPVRASDGSEESASAPSRLGRFDSDKGVVCLELFSGQAFSSLALACWFWMSVQLIGRFSRLALSDMSRAQQPVEIWLGAETEPDEPLYVVRVNRSILRKLRRLARLKKIIRGGTVLRGTLNEETLSPAQLMERRCRVERIGRTRIFGLGFNLRALGLRAVTCLSLRGSCLHLRQAAKCAALLSPD